MEKTKKKVNRAVMVLDLSHLMAKRKFSTFNDMRKESYEFIKAYREQFVKIVLSKHDVRYNENMTKREIHELFEKEIVWIIKDEEKNMDKVYKEGNLIGYWSRDIELFFSKKGRLMCRIEFKVF